LSAAEEEEEEEEADKQAVRIEKLRRNGMKVTDRLPRSNVLLGGLNPGSLERETGRLHIE
jgi:hypothetical protein